MQDNNPSRDWNMSQEGIMLNHPSMSSNFQNKSSTWNNNLASASKNYKIPYTVKYPTGLTCPEYRHSGNKISNCSLNGDADNFLSLPQMTKSSDRVLNKIDEKNGILMNRISQECEAGQSRGALVTTSSRPIVGVRKSQKNLLLPSVIGYPNIQNEENDPVSPTFSNASSVDICDSGIGSLAQSPNPDWDADIRDKNADAIMKYLNFRIAPDALTEIGHFLEHQKTDPSIITKLANNQLSYSSPNILNKTVGQPKIGSNYNGNLKSFEAEFDFQQKRSLLPTTARVNEPRAFDLSNLPPPEYLRNMPPPNAIPQEVPTRQPLKNNQRFTNSMAHMATPNYPVSYPSYSNFQDAQMTQNEIQFCLPHQSCNERQPSYMQLSSSTPVVRHNPSGPNKCINWQGSLNPHSGAAFELHTRLEECFEQFKLLQNDRKKMEYEVARVNPEIKIRASSELSSNLPQSSSRIDHLVSETLREHAIILTICSRVEISDVARCFNDRTKEDLGRWIEVVRNVQKSRQTQVKAANNIQNTQENYSTEFKLQPIGTKPQRQSQYLAQITHEQEMLSLAKHVYELNTATRKLRNALWTECQKMCSQEYSIWSKKFSNMEETCNALYPKSSQRDSIFGQLGDLSRA